MAVKSKGKQVAKTTTSTKGNTTSMVAQQMGVIVKAGGGDMASKKEKAGASKTCKGDPVAVTTGAVVERVTDIQLRGRVLVDFARRYNSADAASMRPCLRSVWSWRVEPQLSSMGRAGSGSCGPSK